ncbi:MAG TPA: phosphomannomutase/phosphoglucomutase, partial [Terriglobales bacterium]|nr:phosphomannomutase/phosphoglucomutase [Terriglobales bacterium]
QLQQTVLDHKLDLGIAFDGDGDRIGAVDGQGRIIWGDQLLAILSRDVLRAHPGATIIADVKASQTLFDEIARLGGSPLMWKTGHALIKNKMIEMQAKLAGEMSGHIFFADDYYGFDDALYAAIRLLRVMAREGLSLAQLADRLAPAVNTPEIRLDCSEERKFAVVARVADRLRRQGADVDMTDGVRVRRHSGWWLLRASNTQAALVVRAEAASKPALLELLEELRTYLADEALPLHDIAA